MGRKGQEGVFQPRQGGEAVAGSRRAEESRSPCVGTPLRATPARGFGRLSPRSALGAAPGGGGPEG